MSVEDRIRAESGVFLEREFADPEPDALAEDAAICAWLRENGVGNP